MSGTEKQAPSPAARRTQVAHACSACRASKVKCSGERPACSRCATRNVSCVYDVLEAGVTKRESMKRELSGNRRQLEYALAVLDVMRFGSDMRATETLARLRLGMDLKQVLGEWGEGRSASSEDWRVGDERDRGREFEKDGRREFGEDGARKGEWP